jgi:ketosteroid isomerase-like protein
MTPVTTDATHATITHHLDAVSRRDIDDVLRDYSPDSLIFTPDGPLRGLDKVREFYRRFFAAIPANFMSEFELGSFSPLGTDTFIIRDGKIHVQSYAVYMSCAAGRP